MLVFVANHSMLTQLNDVNLEGFYKVAEKGDVYEYHQFTRLAIKDVEQTRKPLLIMYNKT